MYKEISKLWARKIMEGEKTFDQVPNKLLEEVKMLLEKSKGDKNENNDKL